MTKVFMKHGVGQWAKPMCIVCTLAAALTPSAVSYGEAKHGESKVIALFRAQHATNHYAWVGDIRINSKTYVLATRHPGGLPSQLRLDVFENAEGPSTAAFRKVYSGDASEELLGAYAFAFDKSGREQLVLLSNSGQIKVVRVLRVTANGEFAEVFNNGGSEITLRVDTKELSIKNAVGLKVDIYEWDEGSETMLREKGVDILF